MRTRPQILTAALRAWAPWLALAAGIGVFAAEADLKIRGFSLHAATRLIVANPRAELSVSWAAPAACVIGLALLLWSGGRLRRPDLDSPRPVLPAPAPSSFTPPPAILRRLHFGGRCGP